MTYPTIQKAIIKGFITDEAFVVKVVPYLKPEYFKSLLEKELVKEALRFFSEYKALPSEAALVISVSKNLPSQENIDELNEYMASLREMEIESEWLINQTEEFCRTSDFEISVSKALDVLEGDAKVSMYDIPRLIQDSLAISFEPSSSHDFFRDAQKQFSWYKEKVDKLPFDLEMFNKITSGGVERKTLNVMLAGTGVGKSLFMCHFAAKYLQYGYNVLYLTLELSEHKIRQRIDSNLLDIPIQNFVNLDESMYFAKIRFLQDKIKGRLKIHEFPPATVSVNHFRRIIEDLALKDNFKPDIICIDYLNLMNSSRVRQGKSYEVVKAVAEECRGLAVEYNACVWTGTQVNREGYKGDDIGLENTSESMGLPFTADIFLGLSADENLQRAQHVRVKQLKSRYGDINFYNKFIVGIDKQKMRVYDVVQSEANDLESPRKVNEDASTFDKSRFGQGMRGEKTPKTFSDFDF
jgi:archaellum biogenesis ATPase FlaH